MIPLQTAAMVHAQNAPNRKRAPRTGQMNLTRDRLVDGAASCLASRGYSGTTTAAVATFARVAEGTLFRHFPKKTDLIAAPVTQTPRKLVLAFLGNGQKSA